MPNPPFLWLLAMVTLGGAVLRLISLGQPSLWLDEILEVGLATEARRNLGLAVGFLEVTKAPPS